MKAAVDSVLAQSYKEIELIVVDDASTDGTAEYLRELSAVDSRVRFFRNDVSKGACHARNIAIKASNGAFVTGLDDDDEFANNHISALVEFWGFLTKYSNVQFSCIYTQCLMRDKDIFTESLKNTRVVYSDLFKTNYVGNQIFAPRSHFVEAGLFDEKMPAWQDLEFFFRVLKKFGPARLLDLHTYIFDITPRPDRISVGQKAKILKACERMTELHAFDDSKSSQRLLLQVHADHYGFPITINDLFMFAKKGFWHRGYMLILYKYLRGKFKR
jgi:glycosyltransferase involved in cell wall biosynthesis